jgi:hypothetical protein
MFPDAPCRVTTTPGEVDRVAGMYMYMRREAGFVPKVVMRVRVARGVSAIGDARRRGKRRGGGEAIGE